MNGITGYLKAHLAGIGTAITLLIADISADHGISNVSGAEWSAIVAAALIVGGAVAVVPNVAAVTVPDVADQDDDPEVAA